MDIIRNNKKMSEDCWKNGLKKAKKIRRLLNKFSKDTFNRKTICGGYVISRPSPDSGKDLKIFTKILENYRENNSLNIANMYVDMSLYSMGFRRFSADDRCIAFEIA